MSRTAFVRALHPGRSSAYISRRNAIVCMCVPTFMVAEILSLLRLSATSSPARGSAAGVSVTRTCASLVPCWDLSGSVLS